MGVAANNWNLGILPGVFICYARLLDMLERRSSKFDHDKIELLVQAIEVSGPLLLMTALKAVRHRETAEDILQETYLKAYKGLDRFRGDSRIGTWLYRIHRNNIIDTLGKLSKQSQESLTNPEILDEAYESASPIDYEISPEEQLLQKEEEQQVLADIAELPLNHRTEMFLRYQGYKDKEIAKILDKPVNTVKVNFFRGKKKIIDKRKLPS